MHVEVPARTEVELPESPELRELINELNTTSDAASVLARFWGRVSELGTPLIEERDLESGTALATFVWRAVEPIERVLLLEWMTGRQFHEKQMTHLPGTDVWYRSMRLRDDIRTSYNMAPNDSMKSRAEETDWPARFAKWTIDPFNKTSLLEPGTPQIGDSRYDSTSVLEMPEAPPQPWIVKAPDTPEGTIEHHRFASTLLGNERDIWIYRPAVKPGSAPALIVTFDGERALDVLRQPVVYDNLAASGQTLPFYGVMIGNVVRGEELPCNETFLKMLSQELLPWLETHLGVSFTAERTVVGGASYGGLAAMYAGLHAPERFGKVLSQSGSYWWKPDPLNEERPLRLGDCGDYAWLPARAATLPIGSIKVWMEVGTLEDQVHGSTGPSQVSANRHMRDVLIARGVSVAYSEYAGGHDWPCWRNSLAEGIIALIPAE